MDPKGLKPKTTKLFKSLKIMKIIVFSTWKRCASRFCEGSTERQLQIIDMILWSKLCFWKLVKKFQKYQNWFNFGSKPCA